MIDGLGVLAVVPARGGSKGIPLKNLRTIGDRSLVALAGDVAKAVPEIDRRVVSTDHPEIARAAREADLDAPFMRPAELAGDRVGDLEVLVHALKEVERLDNVRYDIVVMLQPTSPLRRPGEVSQTIRSLVEGNYDAVWTVSESDSKAHPLKQLVVRGGEIDYWDPRGAGIIARQQLDPVYHKNGVAYAFTRSCLLEQGTIKGTRTGGLVIGGEHVSIDTEFDLEIVDLLWRRRNMPL